MLCLSLDYPLRFFMVIYSVFGPVIKKTKKQKKKQLSRKRHWPLKAGEDGGAWGYSGGWSVVCQTVLAAQNAWASPPTCESPAGLEVWGSHIYSWVAGQNRVVEEICQSHVGTSVCVCVCVVNIGHFILLYINYWWGSTWTPAACGNLKPSREFLKRKSFEIPDNLQKITWFFFFF